MINENIVTAAENQTCPAIGYQSASMCVPVTITPYAQTGATITKCCGNPVVTPGRISCTGERNGNCSFTISQKDQPHKRGWPFFTLTVYIFSFFLLPVLQGRSLQDLV